jgi:hypothetical protein
VDRVKPDRLRDVDGVRGRSGSGFIRVMLFLDQARQASGLRPYRRAGPAAESSKLCTSAFMYGKYDFTSQFICRTYK